MLLTFQWEDTNLFKARQISDNAASYYILTGSLPRQNYNLSGSIPFSAACNSVFIVDLSCLHNAKDVQCDDMGAWKDNGHYKQWCSVTENGSVTFHRKTRPSTHDSTYFITRKYYVSRDVQKMVVLLNGKSYKFYPVLFRLFNYSPVNSALWHCSNMTDSLCVD